MDSIDNLAIKALGILELRHHSISLEALLKELKIRYPLPNMYSKKTF